jgi:hypothetical protein
MRIVRQGLQGIDLLGHPHGPELRRNVRAHPPRQHQAGEHGTQFEQQALPYRGADEIEGHRAGERVGGLHRQDHAREGGDEESDGHRVDADQQHLLGRQRGPHLHIPQPPRRILDEMTELPHCGDQAGHLESHLSVHDANLGALTQ